MAACHVPRGIPGEVWWKPKPLPRRGLERPPSRDDIRLLPTTRQKLHSRSTSAVVSALCDLSVVRAGPAEVTAAVAAWGGGPSAEGAYVHVHEA